MVHEPNVQSPLALRFDEEGRMWVVEIRGYMLDPVTKVRQKLADRQSVFTPKELKKEFP